MSKLQIRVLYPMSHYLGVSLIQQLQELAGPDIRVVSFALGNKNWTVPEPLFNVDVLIKRPESDATMDDFVDVIFGHQATPFEIYKSSLQALDRKMQQLEGIVINAKSILNKQILASIKIV